MLPNINLDDEMFSEISENAKKLIIKYAPEWTDYNAHDPGITFIELFAWLKEMQQYRMDQIGAENRLKFIKLLGITRRHKKPAQAYVQLTGVEESFSLLKGTRFYAGDICFETYDREFVSKATITDGFFQSGDKKVALGNQTVSEGRNLHFYVFGKEPKRNDEFYICFDAPITVEEEVSLYFGIFEDYKIKRNKIVGNFKPLLSLRWEYYTAEGWQEIQLDRDGTYQLLQSGRVKFCLKNKHEELTLTSKGYWIRLTMVESTYDVAPILTGLNINNIHVQQKKTLVEYQDFTMGEKNNPFKANSYLEYIGKFQYYIKIGDAWVGCDANQLEKRVEEQNNRAIVRKVNVEEDMEPYLTIGEGDGFPYQEFKLKIPDLIYQNFEIMVEADNNQFQQWEKVSDFDTSKPEDKHYRFDEVRGIIEFGDCERGMSPEGKIVIISCKTSLGIAGNVKKRKIDKLDDRRFRAEVQNYLNAFGAKNTETIDNCFERFQKERHEVVRAITYEDYEFLVKNTPGLMINNCKAIPSSKMPRLDGSVEENSVNIVVQPYSAGKVRELTAAYVENIYRQLEGKSLIGTKVKIIPPEYAGIVIFGEIVVKAYYRNAREQIEAAVEEFFKNSAKQFGNPVQYSTIYGIIDTLDCVVRINSLVMDAQGRGIKRSINGDVLLPQNGLAYLKEAEYVLSASE